MFLRYDGGDCLCSLSPFAINFSASPMKSMSGREEKILAEDYLDRLGNLC